MQDVSIKILPAYQHLVNSDADVLFLWGGRDSGKSHFLAQLAVVRMLAPEYFRGILVKKTYESIRDSQWQTIKDVVEEAGLESYFKFTQSPLEISTTVNGNKCIARGCDKPEKLKSISNPSHVWFEEGNQLSQEDYETITTTMRTNKARVQEWFSFNPESKGNYEEFWLYRDWFSNQERTFDGVKIIEVDGREVHINYTSVHTTYKNNPYCSSERIARHENLKNTNPYRYSVFTLGHWGNEDNENPFFYSLSKSKHYRPTKYDIANNYTIDFSFDFNHDPCTCVVGQHVVHDLTWNIIGSHYASPNQKSSLENLCSDLKRTYLQDGSRFMVRVTGDAAGKQNSADRAVNVNRYTAICSYLGINMSQVKVERSNLKHTASRDLCNDVLHELPEGAVVFWAGTERLLENLEASYPDKRGSLEKAKSDLGLHDVDAWRYLIKLWFAPNLKGAQFKRYQDALRALKSRYNKLREIAYI